MSTDSCALLSFNLATCVSGAVTGWAVSLAAVIPWWGWVLIALVAVGIAYRLAGWLGVVALAAGAGYALRAEQDATENGDGEPEPPATPPPKPRHRTLFR